MYMYMHAYMYMYTCKSIHVLYISHVVYVNSVIVRVVAVLQVYTWLSEHGWRFIVANNFIGGSTSGAQGLIQQHDTFEAEAKVRLNQNSSGCH